MLLQFSGCTGCPNAVAAGAWYHDADQRQLRRLSCGVQAGSHCSSFSSTQ